MERGLSISSDPTSIRRQQHPVLPTLPPWERRNVSQVPFMEPGSPPLARSSQAPFTPNNNVRHRPKLSTSTSAPCASEYSSPVDEHSNSNPWKSSAPSRSTASPPALPAYAAPPYEAPAYEDRTLFVPACESTSQPPPSYVPQAPPTPPDSISRSPPRPASASPPTRTPSKALPGTMSSRTSRNRSASQRRGKIGARDHRTGTQTKQDQAGLGTRFKSAFRDIFKKDPVDESQFERISDRHWTEEY